MKLRDKKHTIAQRMGRMEKVLTQLYLTNVNFGERIKKIVEDGRLVPLDLTVQTLINALLATPSKVSYKLDLDL